MAAIIFDTHEAVKLLRKKGFSKEQAEALVDFEKSKDTSLLPTKHDLEKSISSLKIWTLTMMLGQTALIIGLLKIL
jgi:hypothetical protein